MHLFFAPIPSLDVLCCLVINRFTCGNVVTVHDHLIFQYLGIDPQDYTDSGSFLLGWGGMGISHITPTQQKGLRASLSLHLELFHNIKNRESVYGLPSDDALSSTQSLVSILAYIEESHRMSKSVQYAARTAELPLNGKGAELKPGTAPSKETIPL